MATIKCRSFAPISESVAENHPELTFAKINTEAALEDLVGQVQGLDMDEVRGQISEQQTA